MSGARGLELGLHITRWLPLRSQMPDSKINTHMQCCNSASATTSDASRRAATPSSRVTTASNAADMLMIYTHWKLSDERNVILEGSKAIGNALVQDPSQGLADRRPAYQKRSAAALMLEVTHASARHIVPCEKYTMNMTSVFTTSALCGPARRYNGMLAG